MRTLILLLMIVAGTAAILYFRVNQGMSWDDMRAAIEEFLPKIWVVAVLVAGLAATLAYTARKAPSE